MTALKPKEFDRLADHLSAKKHRNMHLRKKQTVRGESVFVYLNLISLAGHGRVLGHIGGPGIDLEYEITRDSAGLGQFRVLRNAGSLTQAVEILDKEAPLIVRRIEKDDGLPHPVNYKEGEFYAKRDGNGRVTDAFLEAVARKILPATFGKTLVAWRFIILKGNKKK